MSDSCYEIDSYEALSHCDAGRCSRKKVVHLVGNKTVKGIEHIIEYRDQSGQNVRTND